MSEKEQKISEESIAAPKKNKKERNLLRRSATVVGLALILTGIASIGVQYSNPELADKISHNVKTTLIDKPVRQIKEEVFETHPTIHLNGSGGKYELDTAKRGDWVFLDGYSHVTGIPPIWAQHNNRGGDEILSWEVGQKFNVKGSGFDEVFIVVDTRDVYKFGTVDQVKGMQGSIALQTCRYGENIIEFIGAVPLSEYENGWTPTVYDTDKNNEDTVPLEGV